MTDLLPAKWWDDFQCGIEFDKSITKQAWILFGQHMVKLQKATPWMIGDWINFGTAAYGEKYAVAQATLDYSMQALRTFSWMANTFPLSSRRRDLTWAHHREVAGLTEQERAILLDKAIAEKWTVPDLRQHIRQLKKTVQEETGGVIECESIAELSAQMVRWWRSATNTEDIQAWPKERREAVKRELEPVVKIYQSL